LDDGDDYRPLLKEIQSSGESHVVLDISLDKIIPLLRHASEVKMMEEYQSYIITSLDAHTLDYEELKFMRANITTMRLIDPTTTDIANGMHFPKPEDFHANFVFIKAILDWEQGERRHQKTFHVTPDEVHTETALYHGNQSSQLVFLPEIMIVIKS
jgi:glutamate receptor, ionotropic, invertebrate